MRKSIRLTLVACASLVALVFANAAWSAYEPNLLVTSQRHTLGAPTTLFIGVSQTAADDPTAKIDISVPAGYSENLTATPGTRIGDVAATVILRGAGNAEVDVEGQVVAESPASHTVNQCAPGAHTAVWVLTVTLAGTPIRVPIYIDDVTTVPGVSARIQLCLAGPIGTPSNAQLLSALFSVNNVFTNPTARATHLWSSLFTPYNPGSPFPNPPGTVEARAIAPLPVAVTMTAKRKGRVVTISGRVNLPGNAIPATIEIWSGPNARRLRRVTRARVRSNGTFSVRRRVGRRTRVQFYQARLETPFANAESFGYCQTPPPRVPRGCVSATFAALSVRGPVRRVRWPRP
jgi:hypothetical protein